MEIKDFCGILVLVYMHITKTNMEVSTLKKVIATALSLVLLSGVFSASSALAYESDSQVLKFDESKKQEIEMRIQNELSLISSQSDIPVSFENINYTINTNVIQNEEQLNQEVENVIKQVKEDFKNLETEVETKPVYTPMGLSYDSDEGTYSVGVANGVPAIGWGYVYQDFKASVSGGKINSITLLSDSYKEGVTLSGWTPIRSYFTISKNKKFAQFNMKGTISYIFKGSNLDYVTTFQGHIKVSGSAGLTSALYSEWPD